ncbi:rCG55768 [Rattus norvegicus]|uniref:RCG55768 n=1 Tax=Rattus norvegicus TaxID=10116 RepID=A6JLZ1_RAT|nr:rCG55768 [Rattus norvegicus]
MASSLTILKLHFLVYWVLFHLWWLIFYTLTTSCTYTPTHTHKVCFANTSYHSVVGPNNC